VQRSASGSSLRSISSSVSFGSFPEPLGASEKSWFGGLDDSDDMELEYLKWPGEEKLGVGGVEHSDIE
jgi:hypothetical protein